MNGPYTTLVVSLGKRLFHYAFLVVSLIVSASVTAMPPTTSDAGTLRGGASVSPTGAAQYTIPLNVPPGIAGMAPSLSLSYESNRGTGIAGAGWTLDAGMQIIHRCNATVAQDGTAKGVTYSTADRLCLNGQRLVKTGGSGSYGESPSSYRTEIATFQKVVAESDSGSIPDRFVVTQRNGTKLVFGKVASTGGPDGRINVAGPSSPIRLWALSRVEDTYSNYIDFLYNETDSTGEYELDRIEYTGHANTSVAPRYTIKLTHLARPNDARTQYRAGYRQDNTKRLTKIETQLNGTPIVRYDLEYADFVAGSSGHSRLTKVTECESVTAKCLAPIDIDWKFGDEGWTVLSPQVSATPNSGSRYLLGDWDGDGIADLFIAQGSTNPTWTVSLGKNSFASNDRVFSNVSADDANDTSHLVIDFNGDGLSDLVTVARGSTDTVTVFLSSGDTSQNWNPSGNQVFTGSFGDYTMVDFDGDGLRDFVYTTTTGFGGAIAGRKNTGTALAGEVELTPKPATYSPDNFSTVSEDYVQLCCTLNLNSDGIDDLRVRVEFEREFFNDTTYTDFYWVLLQSNGTGYDRVRDLGDPLLDPNAPQRLWDQAIDINGDGLTDLAYFSESDNLEIEINTGTQFVANTPVALPAEFDVATILESSVADYNNDGRQDRLLRLNDGSVHVMVSDGTSLAAPVPIGNFDSNLVVADFNGDGAPDILTGAAGADAPTATTDPLPLENCADLGLPPGCDVSFPPPPPPEPPVTNLKLYLSNTTQSDVVERVTDGFGNFHKFTYVPISQATDTYTLDRTLVVAPTVRPYWNGHHVVATLEMNDGTSHYNATPSIGAITYKYGTALYDGEGRGLLGFRSMDVTNTLHDHRTESVYEQLFPKTGRLATQKVYAGTGTALRSETTNDWREADFGVQSPQRKFVYLFESTTDVREIGGTAAGQLISTTTTTPKYDLPDDGAGLDNEFGQLTELKREVAPANSTDVFTSTYNITPSVPSGDLWCLTQVASIGVERKQTVGASTTSETRQVNFSNDLTFCRNDSEHLHFTATNQFQSILDYKYDSYGNMTGTTLRGIAGTVYDNGLTFEPRHSRTAYDTNNQFPVDYIACFNDASSSVADCTTNDVDNPFTSLEWNDKFGLPNAFTDILGNQSSTMFDNFGRNSTTDFATGDGSATAILNCDVAGARAEECWLPTARMYVTYVTDSGFDATVLLDAFARPVGEEIVEIGSNIRTSTIYDEQGRVQKQSMPTVVGEPIYYREFFYDDADRAYRIDEPESEESSSTIVSTFFDYERFTTITTNQKNQVSKVVTDALGRVKKSYDTSHLVTDPDIDQAKSLVEYTYSPWDEVLEVANKTEEDSTDVIAMTYDPRGRLATIDDPDRGLTTLKYDPADAVVWREDAKGQIRIFKYDNLGRVIERNDAGQIGTFKYGNARDAQNNVFGKLFEYETGGHKVTYTFDFLGRIDLETTTIPSYGTFPAAGSFEFDYDYTDPYGRLSSIKYPETDGTQPRLAVEYLYANGSLSSVRNKNDTSEVFYTVTDTDGWGNVSSISLGNGLVTTRDYDAVTGRLNKVMTGLGGGSGLQNLTLSYDAIGNLTSREDASGAVTLSESFGYDSLNRLVSSTLTNATKTDETNLSVSYYQNGNIKTKSDVAGTFVYGENGNGPHQLTSRLNGPNTFATFDYDANGNMTDRDGQTITWTSFDKPKVINFQSTPSSEFWYDANYSRYRMVEHPADGRSSETIYIGGGMFERQTSLLASNATDVIGYRHAIMANGERVATMNFVEAIGDSDGDGIVDAIDNCATYYNPNQIDTNGDGIGNRCDPDYNNDGVINIVDLGLLRTKFFTSVSDGPPDWDPDYDLNSDGVVNPIDLGILRQIWDADLGPGPAGNTTLGWYVRYFHKDHLMSVTKVSDETGTVVREWSFDAFGKIRDPLTWEAESSLNPVTPKAGYWNLSTRGYTGHEQLITSDLVHMNGRLYDPTLGRVISSDPFIPRPLDTQSYNRLSYVSNRPLSFADPSGFDDCESIDCPRESPWQQYTPQIWGPNFYITFDFFAGQLRWGIRAYSDIATSYYPGNRDNEDRQWDPIDVEIYLRDNPLVDESPQTGTQASDPTAVSPSLATSNTGPNLIRVSDGPEVAGSSVGSESGCQYCGGLIGPHQDGGPLTYWWRQRYGQPSQIPPSPIDMSMEDSIMSMLPLGGPAGRLSASAVARAAVTKGAADDVVRALPFPSTARRFFSGDGAVEHFAKHGSSIQTALGRRVYTLKDYLDEANSVIQNGTFVSELNGFVRFIGAKGKGNYAFVGLDRASGNITTFHIKSVKELSK